MPNRDGTGPVGQGPLTGRRGRGLGRGQVGLGKNQTKRGAGGSEDCVCPKCGYSEAHVRGRPCTELKCPKCGTAMRGVFCR